MLFLVPDDPGQKNTFIFVAPRVALRSGPAAARKGIQHHPSLPLRVLTFTQGSGFAPPWATFNRAAECAALGMPVCSEQSGRNLAEFHAETYTFEDRALRMLRHLTGIVLLVCVVSATPVPGFSPRTLVENSTAIVIGKVEYISSTPKEGMFGGSPVPAKEYLARVNVDRVVKGTPDLLRTLNLHWIMLIPNWGTAGYASPPDGRYVMLFLKRDELPNTFTFASPYYPSVFASASTTTGVHSEPCEASDEQILHKVIEEMGRFIESAGEDGVERTHQLWQLAFLKDSMVHDIAAKVARDSNPDLRDMAIFTLLRLKDASYLPMAREEILRAANESGTDVHAGNLVLAITQEFPGSESVGVLKAGAKARSAQLRRTIAYAARSTRSPSAIPILLPLVDDPDDEVAWNAMHSLGELTNHLDWRPQSKESEEWQRCLGLWHSFSTSPTSAASPQ